MYPEKTFLNRPTLGIGATLGVKPEVGEQRTQAYVCECCGAESTHTTNHNMTFIAYCRTCSWAPGKFGPDYMYPFGYNRAYRVMVPADQVKGN